MSGSGGGGSGGGGGGPTEGDPAGLQGKLEDALHTVRRPRGRTLEIFLFGQSAPFELGLRIIPCAHFHVFSLDFSRSKQHLGIGVLSFGVFLSPVTVTTRMTISRGVKESTYRRTASGPVVP